MRYKQNLCPICSELISNPVCEKCYTKEIENWLRDEGMCNREVKVTIAKIKKEIFPETFETLNGESCIICGREILTTCSYCFFLKAGRILKKLNFSQGKINDFLEIFNYRHYQEDYHL